MDLIFCGIIDIIMVIFLIASLILGIKKGFLTKFIGLASGIVALVIAIIFCQRFADMLVGQNVFIEIKDNIYNNIVSSEAYQNNSDPVLILESLGFPGGISNFIASMVGEELSANMEAMAISMSENLYRFFMVIISFAILLVGCWILSKVLKIVIKLIREGSGLIRVVDGILGAVFYVFLAIVSIYVLFFILSLVIQIPGLDAFRNFVVVDMQLDTDKFRLSGYIYEHNILANFFKIFF